MSTPFYLQVRFSILHKQELRSCMFSAHFRELRES
jgi:hypothetical protein